MTVPDQARCFPRDGGSGVQPSGKLVRFLEDWRHNTDMRHYAYYAARSVRTLETVCAILLHELGLPPFAYEDYYTWKDRLQPYQGAWSEGETLQIRVLRADYDPVLRDHHASCPLDANTLIVVTGTRLPPKVRLALREALGIEPEVCEMWYDQAA